MNNTQQNEWLVEYVRALNTRRSEAEADGRRVVVEAIDEELQTLREEGANA
jgi:hypothetical protein